MTPRSHVDIFLSSVDPRGGFLRIAERIAETAERDPEARNILGAIANWSTGPVIDRQSLEFYQRIRRPGIHPDFLGSPEKTLLAAVTHLRAAEGVRLAVTRSPAVLNETKKGLHTAYQLLQDLEPQFIGELLVETELRASRDPVFAGKLEGAMADIQWLTPQLTPLAKQVEALLAIPDGPAGPSTVARGNEPQLRRASEIVAVAVFVLVFFAVGLVLGLDSDK